MAHSLYITGTEGSSGKTVVTLGLMHFLQSQVRKVAFFRPIIDSEDEARRDSSINLILKHFELDMLYRDTYACTYKEALELVTSGNMSLLIEKIFQKYKALENEYDFVLCQGTDFRDKDTAVQFELNSEIAASLNIPLALVINGKDKSLDAIQEKIKKFGLRLQDATIIQPTASPRFNAYAQQYYEMRKSKGLTLEQAQERMQDSTYFGTMMVQIGDADGMVSGAVNTTAHTIRPAFEIIKTKPDTSIVSSVFFMCLKDRILVFGDCAVNPNPTASQLADIAISSAHTARVFGVEPRVAMLSYSTGSSGKGEAVDEVIEATKLAHERAPELLLDGPIQYDAAIDPEVARTKAPTSPVAGHASVFIFPDLNTGNNTYKAVQRAANALAIGPVLQGLNKPVNDLSRGCTVPDIINTVMITAIQAQAEKGLITLK